LLLSALGEHCLEFTTALRSFRLDIWLANYSGNLVVLKTATL